MKKLNYGLLGLCLALLHSTGSFAQAPAAKVKKALLVIVDGIPADVIEREDTPNIDEISKDGGYTRAYMGGERGGYSQTPTISAVCYTSMITGTWGNKHNVWGNDVSAPNYNYWTIFRHLKAQQPDRKLGIYSTWLDNRTKILGEGKPETKALKIDYHYDGYELDTLRFPHDKMTTYISKIDEEVTQQAWQSIRTEAPDLSWVYLQYADNAGHIFGDAEGMYDAVRKADRQVGDIYNAVKYREQYFHEDWMVVIITDHGRDVATGLSHGGQTDRERTIWIATNKQELNQHFHAHQPAIVDILPSVARHLEVNIQKQQAWELDGVPFVGKVSIADPKAKLVDGKIEAEWTPFAKEGQVELFLASSNTFKEKGVAQADSYTSLGKVDLAKGKASIALPAALAGKKFYKLVLSAEHNAVNRWIIP